MQPVQAYLTVHHVAVRSLVEQDPFLIPHSKYHSTVSLGAKLARLLQEGFCFHSLRAEYIHLTRLAHLLLCLQRMQTCGVRGWNGLLRLFLYFT